MFKVNSKDTRTGAVPEHISYLVLVFLLLNLRRQMAAGNATYLQPTNSPVGKRIVVEIIYFACLHYTTVISGRSLREKNF